MKTLALMLCFLLPIQALADGPLDLEPVPPSAADHSPYMASSLAFFSMGAGVLLSMAVVGVVSIHPGQDVSPGYIAAVALGGTAMIVGFIGIIVNIISDRLIR